MLAAVSCISLVVWYKIGRKVEAIRRGLHGGDSKENVPDIVTQEQLITPRGDQPREMLLRGISLVSTRSDMSATGLLQRGQSEVHEYEEIREVSEMVEEDDSYQSNPLVSYTRTLLKT